ncbi:MAG TPA: CUAEP/CCAEP-tail radical SAM protein [Nitrolancea sp.]|nr:CUAEP/CCAEP-tail radical SAM protein [Nitrolancea sp.]
MHAPGAVLLVSCYELGHQPLSLAFPLARLRQAGFEPGAVDTALDTLSDEAIDAARLVAIAVPMHTALRLGAEIAARVRRRNASAVICCFGLYAWLNAETLLADTADYVIGGESEEPLVALAEALAAGEPHPVIPGAGSRGHSAAPSLTRTDFPAPARDSLPELRRYAHLMDGGRAVVAGYTETTRGCHHTCLHCPVVPLYHGRFFAIPRAVVLADIRQQVAQGAGHITFGDPDFLNGPTHALRVCRALHAEFPQLTFDITTRIEHILEHPAVITELGTLGCRFAVSAVESVSPLVLERLEKGHTKEDVVAALAVLDEAGIAMRPSLLPFTPWTTLDDYLELLDFIDAHDLVAHVDPVHLSIRLLVPPSSALLEREETQRWLGPLDAANYTYTWANPDPRVDALQRQIARVVEAAARDSEDVYDTFAKVRALTHQAAGLPDPGPARPHGVRPPPPRLSESWFC